MSVVHAARSKPSTAGVAIVDHLVGVPYSHAKCYDITRRAVLSIAAVILPETQEEAAALVHAGGLARALGDHEPDAPADVWELASPGEGVHLACVVNGYWAIMASKRSHAHMVELHRLVSSGMLQRRLRLLAAEGGPR